MLSRDDRPEPYPAWLRARVYKEGQHWTWEHQCPWKLCPTYGYPHFTQRIALVFALDHVRRCL